MAAIIIGSILAAFLGSPNPPRPAAFKRLGSMLAKILGSSPRAAAALLNDAEDEGVDVLGATEEGTEVLGDLRSSLLALARDGGLGEALGELAVTEALLEGLALVLALELDFPDLPVPPNSMSMPGMPDIMAGLSPYPYMAAMLGSMAAMAAIIAELLGFLGSSMAMVRGSIFLGSNPRAAIMAGSTFLGSKPMAFAMASMLAASAALEEMVVGVDFPLGEDVEDFLPVRSAPGAIPRAARVLGSIPIL